MTKPVIVKRNTKGSSLTFTELDNNFQNLQDATITLTAGSGGTAVVSDLNGSITLVAGGGISLAGNNSAKTITITSTETQNIFQSIQVAGQSTVTADGTGDTLTLAAGTGIVITTDSGTDTITIGSTASGTTYTLASTNTSAGDAYITLIGSDSSTDSVRLQAGAGIDIDSTDANTITISQSYATWDSLGTLTWDDLG